MEATTELLSLEQRIESFLKDSGEALSTSKILRGLNINEDYIKNNPKDVVRVLRKFVNQDKVIHLTNRSAWRWKY